MSVLKLQVKNLDDMLIVDPADWDNVKDVRWMLSGEEVVNRLGVSYDEFVGIVGKKNRYGNKWDKRREFLIENHQKYVYNEYRQCYILS